MFLNLDIWLEILSYLDYNVDENTLRSLALTCHTLSNLALDAIWRNRDSDMLANISAVANASAPSPLEPFLLYIEDFYGNDERGAIIGAGRSWVLDRPLPLTVCKRILVYLARIRSIVVDLNGSAGDSIWPILSICLGSHGPLLPNLKQLEIAFHIYHHVDYIIPLLSPSIKCLVITQFERPPKMCVAISTVINFAKIRGCDLESFVFFGDPTGHILEAIALFKNLQNVEFLLPWSDEGVVIDIVEFLASLPSLRSLTCHIGIFIPSLDEDRFCHTSLQKIGITATTNMLSDLFHKCIFPSVTDVGIRMGDEIQDFGGLESSFPNTRKLDLNLNLNDGTWGLDRQPLEFDQLAPLLSLPIETFSLNIDFHNLTPSNLRTLAESWPNLRHFRIQSTTQFDPLPSLAAFSNNPLLDYFKVHMSFCRLLSDIPKLPNVMSTHIGPRARGRPLLHTLRFKDIHCVGQPPVITTAKKRILVGYVLLLFPGLKRFKFLGRQSHGALFEEEQVEFQKILSELVA